MDLTSYKLRIPNADFYYIRNFVENADILFSEIRSETEWQQRQVRFSSQTVPLPRLTAWYGETDYFYSGIVNVATPMPKNIEALRAKIEEASESLFNSCLLNLYRTKDDSVSYHKDNEKGMGSNPTVASVSLGAERIFRLKHADTHATIDLGLEHGSLLLMANNSQTNYWHSLIKHKTPVEERINLTFRKMI